MKAYIFYSSWTVMKSFLCILCSLFILYFQIPSQYSDILIFFTPDLNFFLAETAIIERESLFWHRWQKKQAASCMYIIFSRNWTCHVMTGCCHLCTKKIIQKKLRTDHVFLKFCWYESCNFTITYCINNGVHNRVTLAL